MTDAEAVRYLEDLFHLHAPHGQEQCDALAHAIARLEPCDDLGIANHHDWNFCPYCGGRLVKPEEVQSDGPDDR